MRKLNETKEQKLEKRRAYDAKYREEHRQELAEYAREWRKKNLDKVKAQKEEK